MTVKPGFSAGSDGDSDYSRPTTTDLSHLIQPGLGLNNGSSMAAGNTLSDVPSFDAPGTTSEGTADVDLHDSPDVTDATSFDGDNNRVS